MKGNICWPLLKGSDDIVSINSTQRMTAEPKLCVRLICYNIGRVVQQMKIVIDSFAEKSPLPWLRIFSKSAFLIEHRDKCDFNSCNCCSFHKPFTYLCEVGIWLTILIVMQVMEFC